MPEAKRSWTVSELTAKVKGILEPSFTQVWVQGEVSNFRPASSGHVYFSLKDSQSCISVAIFGWGRNVRAKALELKDGLQILCRGKLSIYAPRGTYQLIVDQVEPLGAGALQIAFEKLKEKLAKEGLFNPLLKRPLPPFPSRIAVVTSPTGAAIQDILNILERRAPHLRVTIIPALVQGAEAASQVLQGLELANRYSLGEIVILARGGGSIEDLWGFNDEALARAIRQSSLPVISAVGHEIDFTIADLVADLRAPTPSAAAEMVSGNWVDAALRMQDLSAGLRRAISRDLYNWKQVLAHLAARVISPKDRLREQAQRVDELTSRLERAFRVLLDRKRFSLEQSMGKLDALSPLRVLERGYTLVREPHATEEGMDRIIKSAQEVQSGQILEITFYDGKSTVQAI